MIFIIYPYEGAGPLRFGMTATDAEAHLGPAKSTFHPMKFSGEAREYASTTLGFDENGQLVHIGFSEREDVRVFLGEVDIFGSTSALRDLIAIDGEPYSFVGFVYLLNLGIQLGGFHQRADSGKTVALFEKGRYELKRPQFKPFTLTKK